MASARKLLNPAFENAFNNRLNADVIDLDDIKHVLGSAEIVVLDLLETGWTSDEILRPLEAALANWGPEVLDEFSKANDGDWSFDAELENTLRAIINRMIDTARSRDMSVRAAE